MRRCYLFYFNVIYFNYEFLKEVRIELYLKSTLKKIKSRAQIEKPRESQKGMKTS